MKGLGISLGLGVLLAPLGAQAFFVESRANGDDGNPVPVAYDTATPVQYRIVVDGAPEGGAPVFEAVAAAFTTWSGVECSNLVFERGPDEATATARHWQTDSERYILFYWSADPALFTNPIVGFTDWAYDLTGELIGGQVILNSLHHAWSTTEEADKLDIQSVATSLIGKVLGISSNMEGSATFPRYAAGNISKRTLGPDDIAAIQYVYGDRAMCSPPEPEAICSDPLGVMECPPPVAPPVGDGGVAPPPGPGTAVDGGTAGPAPTGGDSGLGTGPGTAEMPGPMIDPDGDSDDGCGCAVVRPSDPAPWQIAAGVFVLAAVALRRRRRN